MICSSCKALIYNYSVKTHSKIYKIDLYIIVCFFYYIERNTKYTHNKIRTT